MCKWGTEEIVRVKIAAELSHTGEEYWKDVGIDQCIARIVRALQSLDVDMLGSCCGHGSGIGSILLADGRELIVLDKRLDPMPHENHMWHENKRGPASGAPGAVTERVTESATSESMNTLPCLVYEQHLRAVREALQQEIAALDWVIESLSRLSPVGNGRIKERRTTLIEVREMLQRIMRLTDPVA